MSYLDAEPRPVVEDIGVSHEDSYIGVNAAPGDLPLILEGPYVVSFDDPEFDNGVPDPDYRADPVETFFKNYESDGSDVAVEPADVNEELSPTENAILSGRSVWVDERELLAKSFHLRGMNRGDKYTAKGFREPQKTDT